MVGLFKFRHNKKENGMIGQLLIGLIAVLHVYILELEMFLWDKTYGLKAFGNRL